jgi:O-antigen ligase
MNSPNQHRSTISLIAFTTFFPLVIVPGAPFWKPGLIFDTELAQALEMFQLFPKVLVLLLIGLLGMLSLREIQWRKPFVLLLSVHLLLVLVSSLNARDDLSYALLGPQRRLDGLLYHLGLVLFGIFAYQMLLKLPNLRITLMAALFVGGTIQAVLALLQRLQLDPIGPLVKWSMYSSPVGSLSHPGMLAGLLLPTILLGIWLTIEQSRKEYRWLTLLGLFLSALALGATANRAALIALIVGVVGLSLIHRTWRTLLISAFAVMSVFCVQFVVPNPQGFTREYTATNTLESRFQIWALAYQSLSKIPGAPLIGGGSDAFRLSLLRDPPIADLLELTKTELAWPQDAQVANATVVMPPQEQLRSRYIHVEFERFGGQANIKRDYPITLDKAHNLLLDRLLAFGGLSAMLWVVLYLFPVWKSWRNRNLAWLWIMIALMVYYLAWFPVVGTEPLHLLLVAMGWASISSANSSSIRSAPS